MTNQSTIERRQPSIGAAEGLTFFYGLWAFSALGRAVYQYGFRHPESFTPTHISTFVGALYLLIIVGLRRRSPVAWWATLALLAVELAGVLVVGTIDLIWRPFPYASVWSQYGSGYFYMPLLMPIAGLAWLLRGSTRAAYFAPKEEHHV
ncbi:MAG: hypothetical protein OHK0022_19800 [Roseiflexaceae bacterium]